MSTHSAGLCPLRSPRRCTYYSSQSNRRTRTACIVYNVVNSSSSKTPSHVFLFGLGYTGVALGNALEQRGWLISGTCTSANGANRLQGIHPKWRIHPWKPTDNLHLSDEGMNDLQSSTHIVTSIPPLGLPLYDPVLYAQKKLVSSLERPTWLGYISSTGVYGNWQGDWVDESTQPAPVTGVGLVRLQHEGAWRELESDAGLHVFRLGGIYGPGRSILDTLKQRRDSPQKQARSAKRYISRCHVYDICQVVMASMNQPSPGAIYNVVDDYPASREEVQHFARQLMGMEPDLQATSPENVNRLGEQASNSKDEKRVRNARIKEELGVELKYPTYKEGLTAIHTGCTQPLTASDVEILCGRQTDVTT